MSVAPGERYKRKKSDDLHDLHESPPDEPNEPNAADPLARPVPTGPVFDLSLIHI